MHGRVGRNIVAAAALASCLLGSPWGSSRAQACSCRVRSQADIAREAAAIFEGRVLSVDRGDGLTGKRPTIELQVVRSWKGMDAEHATVTTGFSDADCGFGFQQGESYLVYAEQSDNALVVGSCSGSRRMLDASEDLAALGMGSVPFSPRATQTATANDAVLPPATNGCAGCSVGARREPRAWSFAWLLSLPLALGTRRTPRTPR